MRFHRQPAPKRQSRAALRPERGTRRGSVLIVVLILIMLLTYGVYGFTHRMIVEQRTSVAYGKRAQAQASAASGIQLAASLVDLRGIQTASAITLVNRTDLFAGQVTYDGTNTGHVGYVSIVAPVPSDLTASQVQFGLIDESAKLNVNAILAMSANGLSLASGNGAQSGSTGSSNGSSGNSSSTGSSGSSGNSGSIGNRGSSTGQTSSSSGMSGSLNASGSSQGNTNSTSGGMQQAGGSNLIAQRVMLMGLPNMTPQLADAILDYIDSDQLPRMYGAESAYYQSQAMPHLAKNGPLRSLAELLMVRGVTPLLLYGEDANRNGLLDPGEDDGAATPPVDNADGQLQRGWNRYLTVYGAESNLAPGGVPKININQQQLAPLYDAISAQTGNAQAAKFIIAYRMYGPSQKTGAGSGGNGSGSGGSGGSSGQAGGGGGGGGLSGGGSSSRNSGSRRSSRQSSGSRSSSRSNNSGNGGGSRISGGSGGGSQQGGSGSGGQQQKIMRGGLNVAGGGQVQIKSLYALIGAQVQLPSKNGSSGGSNGPSGGSSGGSSGNSSSGSSGKKGQTLTSPWSNANITTVIPKLAQLFALSAQPARYGRLNVNHVPLEILIGLPGMPLQLAQSIVAARGGSAGATTTGNPAQQSTAWLVASGVVNLQTMKQLDKYLTAGGDVFRVQAVGFFEGGGPTVRLEAVIDGTMYPAKIIGYHNLTELGPGYSQLQLLPLQGGALSGL